MTRHGTTHAMRNQMRCASDTMQIPCVIKHSRAGQVRVLHFQNICVLLFEDGRKEKKRKTWEMIIMRMISSPSFEHIDAKNEKRKREMNGGKINERPGR